jgi:hypothetical protein
MGEKIELFSSFAAQFFEANWLWEASNSEPAMTT